MARRSEPKKTPDLDAGGFSSLKVALCQVETREWDVAGNLERLIGCVEEAAAAGAEVAVTPECVLTGYPGPCGDYLAKMIQTAEPIDGPSVTALRERASALGVALAVGFAEAVSDRRFHNTMALFDRDGAVLMHYRKVHCRDFEDVRSGGIFRAGDRFYASDLVGEKDTFRIGAMICFDREVPETTRCLRSLGAQLVVCPLACDTSDAAKPRDFVDNEVITRVRATENEMFIAVVNHAGRFNGGSYVVGPGGEVLSQMDDRPGVDVVDVPVGIVRERFHSQPLGWMGWGYRRPEIYTGHMDRS